MQRILVVGMSGAGKTTAARALATRLGQPMHEMDTLALGPNWSTPSDFVDTVEAILHEPGWVFDSWGYPPVRAAMWAAVDTVVWLDYPRRVVLPRLIRRSLRRSFLKTRIFGGNRERWRDWLKLDHPVWYAIRTFDQRRTLLRDLSSGKTTHRFTTPTQFDRWLADLTG